MGIHDDMFGLVRILAAEIAAQSNAAAPHWLSGRLFEIALERAELFLIILFQVLAEAGAARRLGFLSSDISAGESDGRAWPSMGGSAWDRELTNRDDEAAKRHAFADAVSVMGHVWTVPALQEQI